MRASGLSCGAQMRTLIGYVYSWSVNKKLLTGSHSRLCLHVIIADLSGLFVDERVLLSTGSSTLIGQNSQATRPPV